MALPGCRRGLRRGLRGRPGRLIDAFTGTYSYSLQQTLFAMGKAVLEACPDLSEVRLRLPNKHHFVVDCTPFGLDSAPEVFHADDRPYG